MKPGHIRFVHKKGISVVCNLEPCSNRDFSAFSRTSGTFTKKNIHTNTLNATMVISNISLYIASIEGIPPLHNFKDIWLVRLLVKVTKICNGK